MYTSFFFGRLVYRGDRRRELRTKELLGMVTDITYQNWWVLLLLFTVS
jgi:hypothetical protein